jgi:hypothetical protein
VAGARAIILIAENERQETKLVRPRSEGGDDLDGLWNDDLHHSAVVALTGQHEAYYSDYRGRPQELISAAKYGYLFQGQPYTWQEAPRGMPTMASVRLPLLGSSKTTISLQTRLVGNGSVSKPHRAVSRHDCAPIARALDANDFSGPGVWGLDAFPFLCRHVRRLAPGNSSGTA